MAGLLQGRLCSPLTRDNPVCLSPSPKGKPGSTMGLCPMKCDVSMAAGTAAVRGVMGPSTGGCRCSRGAVIAGAECLARCEQRTLSLPQLLVLPGNLWPRGHRHPETDGSKVRFGIPHHARPLKFSLTLRTWALFSRPARPSGIPSLAITSSASLHGVCKSAQPSSPAPNYQK